MYGREEDGEEVGEGGKKGEEGRRSRNKQEDSRLNWFGNCSEIFYFWVKQQLCVEQWGSR